MPRYPLTREQQAEQMGISVRYVDMYRAVERLRPDLIPLIDRCAYTINMARPAMRPPERSHPGSAVRHCRCLRPLRPNVPLPVSWRISRRSTDPGSALNHSAQSCDDQSE
jgi:hypothetical protein